MSAEGFGRPLERVAPPLENFLVTPMTMPFTYHDFRLVNVSVKFVKRERNAVTELKGLLMVVRTDSPKTNGIGELHSKTQI